MDFIEKFNDLNDENKQFIITIYSVLDYTQKVLTKKYLDTVNKKILEEYNDRNFITIGELIKLIEKCKDECLSKQ